MEKEQPPSWFVNNINYPFQKKSINVPSDLDNKDCNIVYLYYSSDSASSSKSKKKTMIMVHGGSAHAYWWGHIAPFLLNEFNIVSIHLGGMGESDHREKYDMKDTYAKEILAVADAEFSDSLPLLVAHSFGGYCCTTAIADNPRRFSGLILVDSGIRGANQAPMDYGAKNVATVGRPHKIYPDEQSILKRFRMVPDDPKTNLYIKDYYAKHAIRKVQDGYVWRFDPNRSTLGKIYTYRDVIKAVRRGVKIAVVYGEKSSLWQGRFDMSSHAEKSNEMASAPTETKMLKWLKSVLQPGGTPFIPIAEAGHHIHVDQPIALTSVLRSLSSDGGYFYKKPSNLYNDAAILNPTVKTILITGAGSGIGRAWTKGFINDGYTVTAADINKNSLNSLMMELDSPKLFTIKCDVSKAKDVQDMVENAYRIMGNRLDVLFNNAGVSYNTRIEDSETGQFEQHIAIHLFACVNGMKAAIPIMRRQKFGRIINTVSRGAEGGGRRNGGYAAAKAGMWAVTRAAAHEVADTDILINMIFPGPTNTPIWGRDMPNLQDPEATYPCAKKLANFAIDGPTGKIYTPFMPNNGVYRMFDERRDGLDQMILRRRERSSSKM